MRRGWTGLSEESDRVFEAGFFIALSDRPIGEDARAGVQAERASASPHANKNAPVFKGGRQVQDLKIRWCQNLKVA
jgi:hypothetical protein